MICSYKINHFTILGKKNLLNKFHKYIKIFFLWITILFHFKSKVFPAKGKPIFFKFPVFPRGTPRRSDFPEADTCWSRCLSGLRIWAWPGHAPFTQFDSRANTLTVIDWIIPSLQRDYSRCTSSCIHSHTHLNQTHLKVYNQML